MKNLPNNNQEANPYIAIKGDGTEKYGARIYRYFLDKGIDMGKLSSKDFKPKVYYHIEDNEVVYCPYLPKHFDEKTLKKIK